MEMRDHPLMSARQRRQLLQLPATFIASRLGITVTSYNRFERGERRAYVDQAHVIAKALGCTVDDLARPLTVDEELELIRRKHNAPAPTTSPSTLASPADGLVVDAQVADTHTPQEQLDNLLRDWEDDA